MVLIVSMQPLTILLNVVYSLLRSLVWRLNRFSVVLEEREFENSIYKYRLFGGEMNSIDLLRTSKFGPVLERFANVETIRICVCCVMEVAVSSW